MALFPPVPRSEIKVAADAIVKVSQEKQSKTGAAFTTVAGAKHIHGLRRIAYSRLLWADFLDDD